MIENLRDWAFWWLEEMRVLFGDKFNRPKTDGSAILAVVGNGLVSMTFSDIAKKPETVNFEDLIDGFRVLAKEITGPIIIRFDADRCIVRHLSSIALPLSRNKAAAVLDMEASTPFRQQDTYALVVRPVSTSICDGASYVIAKRSIVDPVLAALNKARIEVSSVQFSNKETLFALSPVDQIASRVKGTSRIGGVVSSAVIASIVCASATVAHMVTQYDTAANRIETHIEEQSVAAKLIRAELNNRAARIAELQAVRDSVGKRRPISLIWEELARVLPDSAFLTDMSVRDNTISIAGYAAAASSIIVGLEGAPLFEEAAFNGPVVKIPGQTGDRFAIELKVGKP